MQVNAGMFSVDDIADVAMSMELAADALACGKRCVDSDLVQKQLRCWADKLYGARLNGKVVRTPEEQSARMNRLKEGFEHNRCVRNSIKRNKASETLRMK